ncbi:MAG: hypothetical protein ACREYE_12675, partial [Gammaproteobacteria bacterium]
MQGPTKEDLRSKVEELTAQLERAEKRSLEPKPEPSAEAVVLESTPVVAPDAPAVEAAEATPRPLPRALAERAEAVEKLFKDVMSEIDAFKSGQAYLEGDLPIFLTGLGGPGFTPGQRQINWINPGHIDPQIHVRWSNKLMVDYHRADGYSPLDRKEFDLMVKARGGSYSFVTTPEGHIQCGDLILIKTSKSWYEQLQKRNRDKTARKEGRVKDTLRSKG